MVFTETLYGFLETSERPVPPVQKESIILELWTLWYGMGHCDGQIEKKVEEKCHNTICAAPCEPRYEIRI